MGRKPRPARQRTTPRNKAQGGGVVSVIEGRPRIVGGSPFGTSLHVRRRPRDFDGGSSGPDAALASPETANVEADDLSLYRGAFGARAKPLRLLCVHGVGHQQADPNFRISWIAAIEQAIGGVTPDCKVTIDFLDYDSLMKEPSPKDAGAQALNRRLASQVVDSAGDESIRDRGFGDAPSAFKRTLAYIASWLTNARLRAKLRKGFIDALAGDYDAVLAHSLGSLICYDALAYHPGALAKKTFVTFGSQIGHPAIRDVFAGRIGMIPNVERWFHLFNPQDHVLTARVRLVDPKFVQVDEPFDIPDDQLNHGAAWYLAHPSTIDTVWRALAGARTSEQRALQATRTFGRALRRPDKRALLIGINDYPDPSNRLEGCVNDVFAMSAVLQESDFLADEIRVVLNERATTKGILDRLHWLLDGVRANDQRFLYYSGHGAQIPRYDATGEPSHIDECLVPYDFDWSPAHAIIDRQLSEFYSQLDYDSWFVAVFDCCHAGGLSRGGPLVRGLSPPDDIRHRALRWDAKEGMWLPRKLPVINKSLYKSRDGVEYLGLNGATRRLGRATMLRTLDNRQFNKTREALGHVGPYLPIIYEACGPQQLSYEYVHGGTAYGAYTFCLAEVLRKCREQKMSPTFEDLHAMVKAKMERLKLGQTPHMLGNSQRLKFDVPWTPP